MSCFCRLGLRTAKHRFRPHLEVLESRTLLDAAGVLSALTTQRSWITYAPSTLEGDPNYDSAPTTAHITSDLEQLYDEGWRGIVTYTLLGNYAQIPQIAKNLPNGKKFDYVIAGIYYVDPNHAPVGGFSNPYQEELNNATNASIAQYIDGYLVGNEGLKRLQDGGPDGYTLAQLKSEVSILQTNGVSQDKAVVTSEISDVYLNGLGAWTAQDLADFRNLGDWWFPNMNFYCWGNAPTDPATTWQNVGFGYGKLHEKADPLGKKVIIHESWYPTSGDTFASPANQEQHFRNLVGGKSPFFTGTFYFVWGAAYDQYWNNNREPCNQGGHWGLHSTYTDATGPQPTQTIADLKAFYTSTYGTSYVFNGSPGANAAAPARADAAPDVQVLDARTGAFQFSFDVFDAAFTGAVRVATGDVTGDKVPDLIVAPGPGLRGGDVIKVFDGAALRQGEVVPVASFQPFGPDYHRGLYIAAGSFDGDEFADLVVSRRTGRGPRVYVLDGQAALAGFGVEDGHFRPFSRRYRGAARVAVGDVNADGITDIICGQASHGAQVTVISGLLGTVLSRFRAAGRSVPGGVWVAAGRANDDDNADIIVGLGRGVQAQVKVYQGTGLTRHHAELLASNRVGGKEGVGVVALDLHGDQQVEVFSLHHGPTGGQLDVLHGLELYELDHFFAEAPTNLGPHSAAAYLG